MNALSHNGSVRWDQADFAEVRVVSAAGQDTEAARNLFAMLRELDASRCRVIVIDTIPENGGLWPAIGDRVQRASKPLSICF